MKKILIVALALMLASCAPIAAPVQPTAVIPPTPIIVTVQVPVVQTQIVVASPLPTNSPAPTATAEPPTQVPTTAPTTAPVAAATNPPAAGGATATATLPADAGGNLFTNVARSGSFFDLRCLPQELTFSVSTSNPGVVEVDFWYRLEDLTTQPITISPWKNLGKMATDKNGNYSITVNTLANLSPDLRASAKAWFDYEFIGIGKDATAAGRSGIIEKQVLYLKDCP